MSSNPYDAPSPVSETTGRRRFLGRGTWLLVPPVLPLLVHGGVGMVLAEVFDRMLFTLGAGGIALAWGIALVERLELTLWKQILVAYAVGFAILASTFGAPWIMQIIEVGR